MRLDESGIARSSELLTAGGKKKSAADTRLSNAFSKIARSGAPRFSFGVPISTARSDSLYQEMAILAFQEGRPGTAEALIEVYSPLVKKFVRIYEHAFPGDAEDLFQEGLLGVLDACSRWDPAYKTKPTTFIYPNLRAHVGRYASQRLRVVRKPVQRKDRAKIVFFSTLEMRQAHPRGPSTIDLRPGHMDLDGDDFEDAIVDESMTAEEILCGIEMEAAYVTVVEKLASRISESWLEILFARFSDPPRTLRDLGDERGISRERVRQIEGNALQVFRERCELVLEKPNVSRTTIRSSFDEVISLLSHHGEALSKSSFTPVVPWS